MSKEFVAKSIPLNSEEKTGRPITEREFAITVKSSKIFLKIFICLLILCLVFILGFSLSELSYTARHQQIENFYQFVYVYDTEQKLENYYKKKEREYIDKNWGTDDIRNERPLARVGPFVVFASNDNSEFFLEELSSGRCLVSLTIREQSKHLYYLSPLEKDWREPRFGSHFLYSGDGVYESGTFYIRGEDGIVERTYHDKPGNGVFDRMAIREDFENFYPARYRLNGLTWERIEEDSPRLPPGMPLPSGQAPEPH